MARKHNLTVQDSFHYHDTPSYIPITDNVEDLLNLNCYHDLVSLQIGGQSDLTLDGTDLFNLDTLHDHIAWHISRFWLKQYIDIDDPYHVLTDLNAAVSPLYSIVCGSFPDYSLTLPSPTAEGQFGERIEMGLWPNLPTIMLEDARVGLRTGVDTQGVESALKLPTVSCEATCLAGYKLRLDTSLPAIIEAVDWDMRFGSNLDEMLPALQLNAQTSGGLLGFLDATLPGVECEAASVQPVSMWLDAYLPALEIDTNHTISRVYDLDATLPTLQLEAFCYGGPGAVLDATLPPVRMLAAASAGISGDILTLDATLPTVVMRPVGTGAGVDGLPGGIQEETRFDDYVLRYARNG